MNKNYLKNEETFFEYPNKYLKITSNSNLYYIEIENKKYIVRSNTDSIETTSKENLYILTQSFFDIISGIKILTYKFVINNNKMIASTNNNIKLLNLSKLLNLKGNDIVELDIDDVKTLLNFKEEKAKEYRKFYF